MCSRAAQTSSTKDESKTGESGEDWVTKDSGMQIHVCKWFQKMHEWNEYEVEMKGKYSSSGVPQETTSKSQYLMKAPIGIHKKYLMHAVSSKEYPLFEELKLDNF